MSSAFSHLLPRHVITPGERGAPPPYEQVQYIKFVMKRDEMDGRLKPSLPTRASFARGKPRK